MSERDTAINTAKPPAPSRKGSFWLKQLPYIIAWVLALFGVAYTSMSREPLVGYWEFLAVAMGVVCIATGWLNIEDRDARIRMTWIQVLHWAAFLVAMNIMLLPGIQRMMTGPATGLALLMLLALGTFVAGLQISWRICALGIAMALAAPALAWLKQTALFFVLASATVVGIGLLFWGRRGGERASKSPLA